MTNINQETLKVAYLTVGQGGVEKTFQSACALIDAGFNVLELGMPFSDPVADGPVIQAAMVDALNHGTKLSDVFTLARRIKKHYPEVYLVLFSYFNPLYALANEGEFSALKSAGIDAVLTVDLPLEEADNLLGACEKNDIAPIFVITPATSLERIKKINQHAKGFLYYACRAGTTGVKTSLPADMKEKLQQIKSIAKLPVVVGFGISNGEMVKEILNVADGFVVGSLFVKAITDGQSAEQLKKLAKSLMENNI